MKTLYLKMLGTAMMLGMILPLQAKKPGAWTILRPDGIYCKESFMPNNPFAKRVIYDIAFDAKYNLWMVTDNGLFLVSEAKGNINNYSVTSAPSLDVKDMPFATIKRRPIVTSDGKDGIALMLSEMLVNSSDETKWTKIPVAQSDGKSNGIPLETFEDVCYSTWGWAISGSYGRASNTHFGIYSSSGETPALVSLSIDEFKDVANVGAAPFHNLTVDKNGIIWATSGRDLWKLAEGKLQHINEAVTDICVDPEGNAVIATPTGIKTIDKDNNIKMIVATNASYVAFDKAGILWYQPYTAAPTVSDDDESSSQSGILDLSGVSGLFGKNKKAATEKVEKAKPLEPEDALLIRYDIATSHKFMFTNNNCPLKGIVFKVISDKDNYKYILAGPNNKQLGIYIIKEPEQQLGDWKVMNYFFNTKEELNQTLSQLSCSGNDGSFITTPEMGKEPLFISKDGQVKTEKFTTPRLGLFYGSLCMNYLNGVIYVGSTSSLYAITNGAMAPAPGLETKKLGKMVSCMTRDAQNRLWIGTNSGLAYYDGTSYTYFNKKSDPGLPDVNVLSLGASKDHVFVGTTDGLSVNDGSKWTFYNKDNGFNSKRIKAIAVNSKGEALILPASLISLGNQLSIYQNGELKHEEMPKKTLVDKVVVDGNDDLWIADIGTLLCRKANGEYISYEGDKFPTLAVQKIINIAVVNDELRVLLGSNFMPSTGQTVPPFEAEIKPYLDTFADAIFILKLK